MSNFAGLQHVVVVAFAVAFAAEKETPHGIAVAVQPLAAHLSSFEKDHSF